MRKNGAAAGGGKRSYYSVTAADYRLLEEVGYGASATVYRAIYVPYNEIVAVKCLDLDRCGSNLDDIRREAQTMSLIDHPSIIRSYCSFVVDHCLWVVMPFMAEGSCLHLMKIAYPDGFEEHVICSILRETLKALEYLHRHGHIHRDVKAGNILLDSSGTVKVGDFGVTACMFDKGDRQRSRNTFVGTPCWMAPEVLQPGSGYDFKADIWSFGITALELAHGHAPFSKYPPMKVLLMTLQNAPPGLDYDRDKKFSKSFKEMVAMCLVKDPAKRPTAEKLLKHSFFKQAKPPELSVKHLLADLPPLWDRVKALQLKDAAQLALKKMPSSEQEALSQSEYQRGVSAWKFDVEDLKAQASLILDDEDLTDMKEDDGSSRFFDNDKNPSNSRGILKQSLFASEIDNRKKMSTAEGSDTLLKNTNCENGETNSMDCCNQERVDRYEKSNLKNDMMPSTSKPDVESSYRKGQVGRRHQTLSGPIVPSSMERGKTSERSDGDNQSASDKLKRDARKSPNFSGPLMLPNRASANSLSAPIRSSGGFGDSLDDRAKANVVQIKGRFSVTSEHVDLVKDMPAGTVSRRSSEESALRKSASVGDWLVQSKQVPPSQYPKEISNSTLPASLLMPQLQNLFQQTSFQQDLIMSLLNSLQQSELVDALPNGMPSQTQVVGNESVESATTERERLLLIRISELQARMISLTDELTAARLKHIEIHPKARALRSAPLHFPDLCRALFEGAAATGRSAWGPTSSRPRPIPASQIDVDVEVHGIDDLEESLPDATQPSPGVAQSIASTTRVEGARKRKKKSRPETEDHMAKWIPLIIETSNQQNANFTAALAAVSDRTTAHAAPKHASIMECVEKLNRVGWPERGALHIAALGIFATSGDHRDVWMCMSEDPAALQAWVIAVGSILGFKF